jgi:DNA-binding beta-propeller fold protein YncE
MRMRNVFAVVLALLCAAARAEVALVLNSADATVSVIDRATYTELRRLPVGKEPHHLIGTLDDKSVIVASAAGNELWFLDPLTGDVQRRAKDIIDPYHLAYSPDRKWLVIAANRLDHVGLYTADMKPVKRFPLGKVPSHIAYSADSSMAFVTLQESDEVAAIDLARQEVVWKHKVGRQPAGIWTTPDDKHLLVGIMGRDYVEVIDWRARRTVGTIKTGLGAHAFAPMGDRKHLFVSNRAANTVSIIDMDKLSVVRSFATPSGPDCMEVSRDGREIWITARWARVVAVVDVPSGKVIKTIPVGRSPHGVWFLSHAARR